MHKGLPFYVGIVYTLIIALLSQTEHIHRKKLTYSIFNFQGDYQFPYEYTRNSEKTWHTHFSNK